MRNAAGQELIIATTNPGKLVEIHSGLLALGLDLRSLHDFTAMPEAPEEGNSFADIAANKAKYYWNLLRKPVLAEDSGLLVHALDGFPGIFSARIASDDASRIRIILEKLRPHTDRTAHYFCGMTVYTGNDLIRAEGRCDGQITGAPRGNLGFGYDPIFEPVESGLTFAQMNPEQKARYSHRGRALQNLIPLLQRWIATEK